MRKVSIVISFLLLASASSIYSQEEDKPIITVLDLITEDISKSEMGVIINRLSSALFQTGKYTVIDVSQREQILKEMEFSLSGCSDESCMLEVGKMLSAEAIVVGNLGRIGDRIAVSVKMLETETGKTLSTADETYNDINTLVDGIPLLAAKLAGLRENTFTITDEEKKEAPAVRNILAWSSLGAGVVSAGLGAYFLAVALPLINAYNDALDAYTAAVAGDDFDTLRTARDDAYTAAVGANAEGKLTAGTLLTGAGVVLGGLSALFFFLPEPNPDTKVALLPVPGGIALSYKVRY